MAQVYEKPEEIGFRRHRVECVDEPAWCECAELDPRDWSSREASKPSPTSHGRAFVVRNIEDQSGMAELHEQLHVNGIGVALDWRSCQQMNVPGLVHKCLKMSDPLLIQCRPNRSTIIRQHDLHPSA